MERTHTKFPWRYIKTEVFPEDSNDQHSFVSNIVVTHAQSVPREEVEANAKLIAAAPELLQALQRAVPVLSEFSSKAYFEAIEAIKKATS